METWFLRQGVVHRWWSRDPLFNTLCFRTERGLETCVYANIAATAKYYQHITSGQCLLPTLCVFFALNISLGLVRAFRTCTKSWFEKDVFSFCTVQTLVLKANASCGASVGPWWEVQTILFIEVTENKDYAQIFIAALWRGGQISRWVRMSSIRWSSSLRICLSPARDESSQGLFIRIYCSWENFQLSLMGDYCLTASLC